MTGSADLARVGGLAGKPENRHHGGHCGGMPPDMLLVTGQVTSDALMPPIHRATRLFIFGKRLLFDRWLQNFVTKQLFISCFQFHFLVVSCNVA